MMSNYIPQKIMGAIINPCPKVSWSLFVKCAPNLQYVSKRKLYILTLSSGVSFFVVRNTCWTNKQSELPVIRNTTTLLWRQALQWWKNTSLVI